MVSTVSFSTTVEIAASADAVWEVMVDHVRYSKWSTAKRVSVEIEGVPAPNGLGAVRVFHAGPMSVREQVTAWVPHQQMSYRLLSEQLAKNYTSDMVLTMNGDMTTLTWSSSLQPRIPGTGGLVRRLFHSAVQKFAAGIKADAEAVS